MVLLIGLTGCTAHNGSRLNSTFSSDRSHITASFGSMSGTDAKYLNLKKKDKVSFRYESAIEGSFSMKLMDADKNTIADFETNKSGTKTIGIQKDGRYKILIEGAKARGSYDISWSITK